MSTGHMRVSFFLILLAISFLSIAAYAGEFHVTPEGSPTADGSASQPWDLQTAVSHPKTLRPGDTLLLHAGTYRGGFTSQLTGTADAPITVRPYARDRVTIDSKPRDVKDTGLFTVNGPHAIFRDLEFTCSEEKRRTESTGSFPADIRRGGVTLNGSHLKLVNCVIHDLSNGVGFWSNGEGGEIYGCLVYHNGWVAPDRGHGHAIYTQNKTGTKRIAHNILFEQFSHGLHAYGSGRAFINGFLVEGNIAFNNGALAGENQRAPDILIGGGSPSERIAVVGNFTYSNNSQGVVRLGYGADNKDLRFESNYLVGALEVRKWDTLNLSRNTLVARNPLVRLELPEVGNPTKYAWNSNQYVPLDSQPNAFAVTQKGKPAWSGALDDWRRRVATDSQSTLETGPPRKNVVAVLPNEYEPGRAHIVIYNWAGHEHETVDVSSVLKVGQRYRIVSPRNFFGPPVLEGTYDGKPLRLPMKPVPPAQPVGMPDFKLPVTEPEFAVFVLLPATTP